MARRVGDDSEEVGRGVGDDVAERVSIAPEGIERRLELRRGGGRAARRPVLIGPRRLEVVPVADVVEDVRLGGSDVLEQVPRRVGRVGDQPVDAIGWEVRDGGLERHVGALRLEQLDQLLAGTLDGFGHAAIVARRPIAARLAGVRPGSRPAA